MGAIAGVLGALGLGKIQAIAGLGMLAACGILWLLYDGASAKRALAEVERDQALAVNAQTLQQLDLLKAGHSREIAALAGERDAAVARGEKTKIIIRRISDAPKSNACIGSPAVRAYFGELRRQAGSGAGSSGTAPGQSGIAPVR